MEQDWSAYLIRAEALLRKATDDLNGKRWDEADEHLANIIHNARMARVWVSQRS